jgi:hypothetical protein
MPRIPDFMLDGVAFLYPTVDDARRHAKQGGTCFIVGRPTKEILPGHPISVGGVPIATYVPYAVSNRHVVWSGGCPVLRVNRRDGSTPDVIELDINDWHVNPNGSDVAVACLIGKISEAIHKVSFVPTTRFITREMAKEYELGVGDEVLMVGRFINHQGKTDNLAAARFGSISVMPAPIRNKAIGKDQLSYAVEMRSRTGFSGSLVAAYRTVATVLTEVKVDSFYGILGVNWGYILDENGENTWLNGVVPAWEIVETMDVPALAAFQAEAARRWDEIRDSGAGEAVPAVVTAMDRPAIASGSEPPATADNPSHREDFTSLLRAAATPKLPKGRT